MSNAQSTQAISTSPNAEKVSIMLFTDQRFCITPPYSTTRPGTLISPTNVAAVICQALSPGLSQVGYGAQAAASTLIASPFEEGKHGRGCVAGASPTAVTTKTCRGSPASAKPES